MQIGDNCPLHLFTDEELKKLKIEADRTGVGLQVGTKGLTIDNALRYLAICTKLSSPFLRMVIDDEAYHPSEAEVVSIIRTILLRFKNAGVMLAIENHDRFSAQVLKTIIETTDQNNVGICLDTANSLGSGEGLKETVYCLAPYVVNLHMKDFTIQRLPHKMGFTVRGCPAGEGLLNIPRLLDEIERYGKCTTATLEVWSDPEPTIEGTIEKEKAWVAKSIQYLKTMTT